MTSFYFGLGCGTGLRPHISFSVSLFAVGHIVGFRILGYVDRIIYLLACSLVVVED